VAKSRVAGCVLLGMLLAVRPAPAQVPVQREMLDSLLQNPELLSDPEDILAWVTAPRSARPGELVVVKVLIENARPDSVLRLSSIDIEGEFLAGFEIERITPAPRNRSPVLGGVELEYPRDLNPNETLEVEFTLRAKAAGVFIGDIDIYEGSKFLTRVAQVRVKP
jgi:hypothetical protein